MYMSILAFVLVFCSSQFPSAQKKTLEEKLNLDSETMRIAVKNGSKDKVDAILKNGNW